MIQEYRMCVIGLSGGEGASVRFSEVVASQLGSLWAIV